MDPSRSSFAHVLGAFFTPSKRCFAPFLYINA